MIGKPLKDPGASIRQRLLNHAKEHGDEYQRILTRYAIERLLFRLSQTEARERYVLKGAMLFVTWPEQVFRPTGDLDLLGQGDPDPAAIIDLFTLICQVEAPADGIIFDPSTLQVEAVREEEKYQGVRLSLRGRLGTAVIPVQVDIGFGDSVHPAPSRNNFPSLLPDLPAADVLMYPPETVIAEKFEAMIRFGEANGRIKDFHDIWVTARTFAFNLSTLVEAVSGTLQRRETAFPTEMPVALTPQFAEMADKQALWTGFLRRNPPTLPPPPLGDLLAELRRFFEPVLAALPLPESATGRWNPDRGAWE
ncbi:MULTISPECIES: nucleotidyl transferase AbiEii/AbiGii toxin family protein [unclassified Bradyrhizobium]|uniref:nucleotidyl transferase AbiEii/AbiGii toxin family protein n=1 Tax=unclassified Bradyrhizobium TaxID=2631580 RepID=UPI001FF90D38|nr:MULTISPECIES: nucleotidyl transferase AbiEii/AbiGii toxin family protein [unclassified Bradyrhizobium]MCK1534193.1 nucleotidyl transferase AbiEii/AbiGii toxin family protein [Bradyrhizobium sp. 176]MCK1562113.1 nucleotidyl transferase AbiEii/AbiGii toxin family protein [Bradyrhizobium sp. 171]